MNLWTKIISGAPSRKTRLHDAKGNFCGWRVALLHGPFATITGFLRLVFGYRPALPWIPRGALAIIQGHLKSNSRVLEFGSGMSSIWLAKHAGEVHTIDDNPEWYGIVTQRSASFRNITCALGRTEEEYASFMSDDKVGFDLIVVDGAFRRSECVKQAIKMLKPGGMLYLDNTDWDTEGGDMRTAESLAKQFAKETGADVTEVTDFSPTQFFVSQGLVVKVPLPAAS